MWYIMTKKAEDSDEITNCPRVIGYCSTAWAAYEHMRKSAETAFARAYLTRSYEMYCSKVMRHEENIEHIFGINAKLFAVKAPR